MKRGVYAAMIASTAEELNRRYCGSGREPVNAFDSNAPGRVEPGADAPLHSGFGKSWRRSEALERAPTSANPESRASPYKARIFSLSRE
jgi:hypothetical protein